jgi:hypothetical protein
MVDCSAEEVLLQLREIPPVIAAVRFAKQIELPPASSATAGGTFPLKTGEPQTTYMGGRL